MILRVVQWLFIAFMLLTGVLLSLAGGYLGYLGGSWYYVLIGLVCLIMTVLLMRRDLRAVQLFGLLLAGTLIWSWYEADGALLSFLPRVAFWLVLAVWFFTPWYKGSVDADARNTGQTIKRWLWPPVGLTVLSLLILSLSGYEHHDTGTVREQVDRPAIKDWQQYGNTDGGTRFAELEQINTETVSALREVWRYRTGVENDFKMTPLQVDGLLYICGALNVLMAVDSETGVEVWRYDPKAKAPAKHQYARTCRGISYHAAPPQYQGECPTRIVTGTVDARLLSVDAKTGQLCTEFGDNGIVDLRKNMGAHLADQYYVTSPPLVADDVFVVGGLVLDSQDLGLPSGVVRAFNAITGEFAWAWDVGRPGEYGEPREGEIYTPGTPNVWSIMSYDAELDLIYAPTGNASPDYYGGSRRPFDEEWSSAIVALDGATGAPRWKFQTVHHDIWDYDLPAQPVLVDVQREGRVVPSVAVPTKTGEVFLLDRRDGTPVYPIEERPVPQDPETGEYVSPTQPFSALPNFHPYRHEKDMWGLTPLDQLVCRIVYKRLNYQGLFTPPSKQGTLVAPGNFGGFNWGSVSVDADHGLLVAAPMLLAHRLQLFTPQQVAEAGPVAGKLLGKTHPAVRMNQDAPMPDMGKADPADPYDHKQILYYGLPLPLMSFIGTQVPCFEPPWSQIAVIDLNTNQLLWQRPLGTMKDAGPFGWRSGLSVDVGVAVRAGTLTTRGGLTFVSSTMDSTVRAYDVRTGEALWSNPLPGNGQATPMTYEADNGRQYLIVTVPNPSWRYPRDPKSGTYTDSQSVQDGKGGYVIAYAID